MIRLPRVPRVFAIVAMCLSFDSNFAASASAEDVVAADSAVPTLAASMIDAPILVASTFDPPALDLFAAVPGDSAAPQLTVADTTVYLGPRNKRFLLAASEVVGINTLIWSYNRYIRQGGENPGFRIGFNSWQENFENGYEWDDNSFATNQFAHPYHGSLYFNAARSNGYDFWQSIPFAFAGSFMWEHFYETHHAAYNDWVNTSIGGTSLGEMMWRLSDMVLDNTATGGGRRWREVGGFLVNPMRGFNRMVTGDWSRVGPNPEGRFPSSQALQLDAGLRTVGEDKVWETDTTRVFVELRGFYGDPFKGDRKKPFDSIELAALLNFGEASTLAGLKAHGLLGATQLKKSDDTQHLLGAFLNFDYANTFAYEAGQQSLGAGLLSRFANTPVGPIDTQVHLNGIILGGVQSDYASFTGRSYDYGPGVSASLSAAIMRHDRPLFLVAHSQYWIHTLNGTAGDHHLSTTRVRLNVPIASSLDVGAQYLLYLSDNDYEDYADTHNRYPEVRGYLSMPLH